MIWEGKGSSRKSVDGSQPGGEGDASERANSFPSNGEDQEEVLRFSSSDNR